MIYDILMLEKLDAPKKQEAVTSNAMHSFGWMLNDETLATAALGELVAEIWAVGVVLELEGALFVGVAVALLDVVDVVFGLGSSSSPSRYSLSS